MKKLILLIPVIPACVMALSSCTTLSRTRHHDHDDAYGVSRHTHSDQHQHYRDAPEHGRLLSSEIRIVTERETHRVSLFLLRREPSELAIGNLTLGRRFSFLFNCLTNDRRDRL